MKNSFLKICSMLLVLVLLANMLPLQVFAQQLNTGKTEPIVTAPEPAADEAASDRVIAEIKEKRTEFSKEFLLVNGLHMITVYPEAVHYAANTGWEEIDNTLIAKADGTITNTAGVWDVSFPQQLSKDKSITIEKDGYTLSFFMAGELTSSNNVVARAIGSAQEETLTTSNMRLSAATTAMPDLTKMRASVKYAEMVPEKVQSQITYANVYQSTDITYDLQSNKVKESVILESYRSNLRGYRYTLDVGEMLPVLEEDGQILFYDAKGENIVMVMPAPYLIDDAGVRNDDVRVQLTGSGSRYTMTYLLPQQWLAAEDRAWPVVLDPAVQLLSSTIQIFDQTVAENTSFLPGEEYNACGNLGNGGIARFYMQYNILPSLTSSDVIINATIYMDKIGGTDQAMPIHVHRATATWGADGIVTWADQPNFDSNIEDYATVGSDQRYSWDITDIVRGWYAETCVGMVFKASKEVEESEETNYKHFSSFNHSSDENWPILSITFRNNNGLESYWDYTSASAGRAGTGYVNNFTGNLVWIRNDIGFGGNRMPVSINHIYNANDAQHFRDVAGDFNSSNDTAGNEFGLGYGWRTNYNQLVKKWETSIPHSEHYIWEDADGTDHYFKPSSDGTYKDEDGLELTLTLMPENPQQYKYKITDKNGNASYFDGCGRLVKLENNQQTKSCIEIEYYDETNRITTITDGANRKYKFDYEVPTNLLTKISYTGSGAEEISYVCFGYTGSKLSEITDKDGKKTAYSYYSDHLLKSAQDTDGYQLTYDYNIFTYGKPARIKSVTAEHNNQDGGSLAFKYDHNLTKITDHDGHVQIMQFNDMGNTICIQDDEGRAQYAQFANNGGENESSKANQLQLSSKLQNTVVNLLNNSGFESGSPWTFPASSANVSIVNTDAHYSEKSMQISTTAVNSGAYEDSYTVEPGQSVTFSAYVKPQSAAAMLTLYDWGQHYHSEIAYADGGWTRLEVSYTNTSDDTKYICPHILTPVPGTMLADDVQLEYTSTASRYNLVNNGDFQYGANGWFGNFPNNPNGWPDDSAVADPPTSSDPNAPKQPPQLSSKAAKIEGNPTSQKRISQTIAVSGDAGDSFVYAAWAKGDSASLRKRQYEDYTRTFAIEIQFDYGAGIAPGVFSTQFNPDTEQWQYAAGAGVAQHNYSSITVTLCYDHNINTVYFDGIQLFKEEFGTSYTYDADGNVESVVDLQNQRTTYAYDTNSNLTQIIEPDGAEMTYTYDQWNNVLTATTREELVYTFTYDAYGNNLSVSITDGINTVATSATYSADGNRLVSTTDALGKVTTYSYNADTNVLEWVQDPEDTAATRTTYTYDEMYRVESVITPSDQWNDMYASYTYEDDLLTGLETMSTYYTFTYGDFGLRTAVYAGEQLLARYSYTEDGNNYLSGLDYGNGDGVEYNYDDKGRLILETFEDGDTVSYTYNSYGNLATVTDSIKISPTETVDTTTTYYYDLLDRMVKYREVSEDTDHSVTYEYDEHNNLSSLTEKINGEEHITGYEYDEDNRVIGVGIDTYVEELEIVETLYGESYTYDDLGRLEGSTVTNAVGGSEVLEKSYTFRNHLDTTSTQIATNHIQATIGELTEDELYYDPEPYVYDVTYSYTYDGNGNILSISDGTYTTSYVYDSANQLIRENNQELGFTHTWAYDNSGNILYRREYAYTTGSVENLTPTDVVAYSYEHEDLRDMLTEYDGVAITHDAIGNPLYDGEWTYTWEHGRELASMSQGSWMWEFTYDANGMRTRRTDGIMDYRYVYNGSQLTQLTVIETWDGYQSVNTLYFTYSADGTPLTVTSEGEIYFYVTNIQGDVIAILDHAGRVVCRYIYDAWGNVTTDSWLGGLVSEHNPLRYRGYVYDWETELYYLQSRYYSPEQGRFLNADAFVSTDQGPIGNNMFVYCNNNPVMGYDPTGLINWGGIAVGLGLAILAVVAVTATVASAGAASPLLATAITAIGTVASAALAEAAVVTTVGAYCEIPVVYDVTVVAGHDREGASMVYDFEDNTSDCYLHTGTQNKSDVAVTFGSGFALNYDKPGDYAGEFLDISWSGNYKGALLGADYCTSPSNLTNGYKDSHAILWTSGFSFSPYSSKTPTFSFDYYWKLP